MPSAEPRQPIRVFLVDDHPVVRMGLRSLLEPHPEFAVCGETADAESSRREIGRARPDIVVVDVSLPDSDGLSLVQTLQALPSPPRILIVSAQEEDVCADRALQAGARGYLMKQEAAEHLLAALREIAEGGVFLSERFRRQRAFEYRPKAGSGRAGLLALSPREMFVFKLLGAGFSTREIADQMKLSVKTIDTYREHLKIKLNLASGGELVRHAIRVGRLGWL
jgi:DNA-binding NarL/FixJ family response regulator